MPTSRMTLGPWQAHGLNQDHDADRSISAKTKSGNPLWVARVYGGGILAKADPERIANARAIACLPELVEAARRLVNACVPGNTLVDSLRRILARIDGEEA